LAQALGTDFLPRLSVENLRIAFEEMNRCDEESLVSCNIIFRGADAGDTRSRKDIRICIEDLRSKPYVFGATLVNKYSSALSVRTVYACPVQPPMKRLNVSHNLTSMFSTGWLL
jgi:hypothetical protein